ncbi:hypothetical protein [Fusobacterium polymorphum]|uniref:hypothetical protein n=1 Tax=Fusobacterium nucleatum subsp. polymorphum TaxID=76857 RepID=UPI0030090595
MSAKQARFFLFFFASSEVITNPNSLLEIIIPAGTSIVSSFVSLSIYLLFIEEIIYFCFFKSFLADLVNII